MKEEKAEKKTFILAVPTVIIIIIFLIAMPIMIYQKNYKPLSREKATSLSKKILSINNISCEVIIQAEEERVVDYKFKDNVLYCKDNNSIELTDGNDNNKCIYLDTKEKEEYISNSPNNIESFKSLLNTAIDFLENEEYNYEFIKYEKINGIKAACVKLSKDDTAMTIWLDRETGMPIKIVGEYNIQDKENTSAITTIYRYQIGAVKDDNLKLPNTDDYNVTDLNSEKHSTGELDVVE